MLRIQQETLPRTFLTHVAFRVAFQDTFFRLSAARHFGEPEEGFGYLTQVPFLQHVPPQVQMDVLAEAWFKHFSLEWYEASLVDEAVIYAVCEHSAIIAEHEPVAFDGLFEGGPVQYAVTPDELLAADLRGLYLGLPSEGDFLLVSQFESLPPDEARELRQTFQLNEFRLEELFDLLGRWRIDSLFGRRLTGLLTEEEISDVVELLPLPQVSE